MSSPIVVTTVTKRPGSIWNANSGEAPFIFNNDIINTLYVGPKQDALKQDTTSCIPVPPLSGAVWPDSEWWAFAPSGSVQILIIPGASSWSPSPAQVAASINALGIPPSVTGLTSIAGVALSPPSSPITLTPGITANSRIWAASISLSLASDSTGPGALNGVNAYVKTANNNIILALAELAIGGPSVSTAAVCSVPYNGLAVSAGDSIVVVVNGGVTVTHSFIRAAALVLISTP